MSDGNTRSAPSKKKKLQSNKRTVYSKASRRKSLENLGLLVRNRCGTAKLQWPSGSHKNVSIFGENKMMKEKQKNISRWR